ncbi:MAG: FGGY-family carbohydrate kinase [Bacilli bacterium]
MKYIGLDIGTSMVKGQLLDSDGSVLHTCEFESPTYAQDGVFYLRAQELKQIIFAIIKELAKKANGKIKAICPSSLGESFVLIDKKGEPINDFILFVSNLGEEEKDELLQKIDPITVARITGAYPNKMFSFSKLMWMKKEWQEKYSKADKLLLVTGFVAYLLTGAKVSDYSLAARTMLFDLKEKRWSQELIALCGLQESLFPRLVKADEVVGTVQEEIAVELGLNQDCQVLAGGHDQFMAAIGAGLIKPGMANDGTGTSQCVTTIFKAIPQDERFYENNFCVIPYIIEGTYITYAFLNTGGALLKWHRDHLSPLEKEQLKEDYYSFYSGRDIQLPTSLLILPHFAGSGTPHVCGEDVGAIIGLTKETTKEEIYFALMEAATYEMKANFDLLKNSGVKISELSATGGGSKSPSWLKIKANIYNQKVKTLTTPEGGIYGCFLLMKHHDSRLSYEVLMEKYIKTGKVYKPNKELVAKYKQQYRKYKKIDPLVRKIWR